jgi:Acetyltransferase (GNAT) domain
VSEALRAIARPDVPESDWDELVDASGDGWLWHRWRLCEALGTWRDSTDASFALEDDQGILVALVPARRVSFRRARRIRFSRLESLGGPAARDDLGSKERRRILERAVDELRAQAATHGDLEITTALSPLTPRLLDHRPRVNPLLDLGFDNTSTQSWLVDLSVGADPVWAGMKSRARRGVRKAEKAGIAVRVADRASDLDAYYSLHTETYERTGASSHPRAYFEAIWDHFVPLGLSQVFVAELGGDMIAARNFGVFKGSAIYWTGASGDAGLATGANHLLQWNAMEWMIDQGIRWAESGEAFPAAREGKDHGLSYFKESFGGELVPYFRGRIDLPSRRHAAIEGARLIREAVSRDRDT